MQNKKIFITVAIIAATNALGYGIIIPILYPYSQKFGLSVFENGLLFAIFSLCSFISAPIIGRLSDKFGRKPLLLLSISGTALSFFMAAFAPNALFLFLARALDGITAGNLPVVNAVITDIMEPKDRAKGFGIIGASFGFGFLFGPAISAITVGKGLNIPFLIAGVIAAVGVVISFFLLPETNKHMSEVRQGKIFDFKKLFTSLSDDNTGLTFLISLIYSLAWAMFIVAYQPVAVNLRNFSPNDIAIVFTMIGIVGLFAQGLVVPKVVKKVGEKNAFRASLIVVALAFGLMFLQSSNTVFIGLILIMSLANSFTNTLITTILSLETDAKSQGTILGLNASYVSLGNIFGPILGGVLALKYLPLPFAAAGLLTALCAWLAFKVLTKKLKPEETF